MRACVLAVLVACRGTPAIDASTGSGSFTCLAAPADASGHGTYYAADGTGNCSFDASPSDLMVAAMNAPDYNHAAWCGACLAVTGPNGQVVVRVVDQCPGCAHGDLDLSQQAFQMISPLAAGRVAITWREVACDVTGPLAYRFKEGSNAYWVAIQLRNHRYPIAKLEAKQSDGSYASIARADYNYFVAANGLGAGPFALRATDARGHVLDDASVALGDAVVRTGAAQFASCP
jgi:expansin (peptidoglycan-binding protein)